MRRNDCISLNKIVSCPCSVAFERMQFVEVTKYVIIYSYAN